LSNKVPAPASLPPPSTRAPVAKLDAGCVLAGSAVCAFGALGGSGSIGAGDTGAGGSGFTIGVFATACGGLGFSNFGAAGGGGFFFSGGNSIFFTAGGDSGRGKSTKAMGRKS
jgi:hypothetical protein